jgi:hypothetical protein
MLLPLALAFWFIYHFHARLQLSFYALLTSTSLPSFAAYIAMWCIKRRSCPNQIPLLTSCGTLGRRQARSSNADRRDRMDGKSYLPPHTRTRNGHLLIDTSLPYDGWGFHHTVWPWVDAENPLNIRVLCQLGKFDSRPCTSSLISE